MFFVEWYVMNFAGNLFESYFKKNYICTDVVSLLSFVCTYVVVDTEYIAYQYVVFWICVTEL